jgi:exodeoxyribonuclease V beta subunit
VRDDERADLADVAEAAPADAVPAGPSTLRPLVAGAPWHRFPRGAVPGNFLHDQLEWLAGEGFGLAESDDLKQQLLRRCERQGWGARVPDVLAWLEAVVQTPLAPVGASLADVRWPLPEMEFWFPSAGLLSADLDALGRTHLLGGRARPALPERELQGMLMGFADLVFEHGGRYWVLDHKSNHLGSSDADYTADALEAAMAQHRYDVQAAVYLLALHRLLRARLGAGYDPAQQLGGALYFFLRGIRGPAGGCCHVAPPLALLAAFDALLRGDQERLDARLRGGPGLHDEAMP